MPAWPVYFLMYVRFEKMQNLLYPPLCRSVFIRCEKSCFRTKKFRNCVFFCQMPQICRLGRPAVFCKTWKLTSFKSYNGRCSGIRDTSDILFFLSAFLRCGEPISTTFFLQIFFRLCKNRETGFFKSYNAPCSEIRDTRQMSLSLMSFRFGIIRPPSSPPAPGEMTDAETYPALFPKCLSPFGRAPRFFRAVIRGTPGCLTR